MIKAIVYDLDGMVLTAPRYYTEELENKYNIPLRVSLFSGDDSFNQCKKGEISFNEFFKPYYEKWIEYPKYNLTYEEAKQDWFKFSKLNKEIYKIAASLGTKGIKNLILTNNLKARIEYIDELYKLSDIFQIIGSYDLGLLKPDPKIYDKLLEKVDIKSSEVLIFDDKLESISKLKQFGFKAEIYENNTQFIDLLAKYKISF
ncbi:HAD-IA family hydrolase [Candidatus Dojkabacteria bacterium]|nr:HAD-IA family hydrolase [Candidatus Dojkabacteria bacterium]